MSSQTGADDIKRSVARFLAGDGDSETDESVESESSARNFGQLTDGMRCLARRQPRKACNRPAQCTPTSWDATEDVPATSPWQRQSRPTSERWLEEPDIANEAAGVSSQHGRRRWIIQCSSVNRVPEVQAQQTSRLATKMHAEDAVIADAHDIGIAQLGSRCAEPGIQTWAIQEEEEEVPWWTPPPIQSQILKNWPEAQPPGQGVKQIERTISKAEDEDPVPARGMFVSAAVEPTTHACQRFHHRHRPRNAPSSTLKIDVPNKPGKLQNRDMGRSAALTTQESFKDAPASRDTAAKRGCLPHGPAQLEREGSASAMLPGGQLLQLGLVPLDPPSDCYTDVQRLIHRPVIANNVAGMLREVRLQQARNIRLQLR
eukprot:TRINITY_DN71142_c0_g2_i1.p1 TRINITY_DN71142_c0_g2~~TRINITY_DN71142_c0_g2_i1.p1  ORF type:complete len:373 (+),score=22.00 TRINITY_DN71142_c0_g2_i1:207-1325(+)